MARDIGVDLGTANILIHYKGRGIVLNEPAVIALDKQTKNVVAYGREAYNLIGRTPPSIEVIRPLKHGIIENFDLTETLLVLFLNQLQLSRWFRKPNLLISYPSNVSEVALVSLVEAAEKASGAKVATQPEALVAAIGAGMDFKEPKAQMIIDIGGGTTDLAILSKGEVIACESLTVAGDTFDEAIIQYLKKDHHLLVGPQSAEQLKMTTVSALWQEENPKQGTIKGRDLATGMPQALSIDSNDLLTCLLPLFERIVFTAKQLIQDLPPEIASDIVDQGIMLSGGGALIDGMDDYLSRQLSISVIQADNPLTCVAIGTGMLLEYMSNKEWNQPIKVKKPSFWQRIKGLFIRPRKEENQ